MTTTSPARPAPDAPLDALYAVQATSATTASVLLPDGWQQGRGLFGGLVAAVAVRALEKSAPGRALRSMTLEICGPVQPGPALLELAPLRVGNAVTTSTVRLVQGGEVQAHAVGVLGLARSVERDRVDLEHPVLKPWSQMPVIPVAPPLGPEFARYFEFRSAGAFPFSGSRTPVIEGWVRPKHPAAVRDTAFVAACIDAYWPTSLTLERAPRPMATIAYTLQPFAHFDGLDPSAPLYYRAHLLAIDAGYCVETRELWGVDGRLLALNQQTFVIIR